MEVHRETEVSNLWSAKGLRKRDGFAVNAPVALRCRSVNTTTQVERKVRQLVPEVDALQTCGNRRNRLVQLSIAVVAVIAVGRKRGWD